MNAVFFTVFATTSKGAPFILSKAFFTTPGPETPTWIATSPCVTPWNAPAIKGLSSTALQNSTSFVQPYASLSFVNSAVSLTISPIRFTASILIPALVDPIATELQMLRVTAKASGMESISTLSADVIPRSTKAENPPRISTPTSSAALWSVSAIET